MSGTFSLASDLRCIKQKCKQELFIKLPLSESLFIFGTLSLKNSYGIWNMLQWYRANLSQITGVTSSPRTFIQPCPSVFRSLGYRPTVSRAPVAVWPIGFQRCSPWGTRPYEAMARDPISYETHLCALWKKKKTSLFPSINFFHS